jgi:DNA-binding XRE family transcriptional regulator
MPEPNRKVWQRCRAQLDLTSVQAAALLRISGGALRAIECGSNTTVSLRLAFRASRLYSMPVDDLLIADGEDRPDERPKGPAGPKPRKKRAANKGAAA